MQTFNEENLIKMMKEIENELINIENDIEMNNAIWHEAELVADNSTDTKEITEAAKLTLECGKKDWKLQSVKEDLQNSINSIKDMLFYLDIYEDIF